MTDGYVSISPIALRDDNDDFWGAVSSCEVVRAGQGGEHGVEELTMVGRYAVLSLASAAASERAAALAARYRTRGYAVELNRPAVIALS